MSKDSWLSWYQVRRVERGVADLASRLTDTGPSRILDFGCGTGRHTVYLARMDFDVFGFDWSGAAIEIAKRELANQKLEAYLQIWDMNNTPLPYKDSFFDVVISVRVLHHTFGDKIKRIASFLQQLTCLLLPKRESAISFTQPSLSKRCFTEQPLSVSDALNSTRTEVEPSPPKRIQSRLPREYSPSQTRTLPSGSTA
jgi:SAM-dependent methyltransferase